MLLLALNSSLSKYISYSLWLCAVGLYLLAHFISISLNLLILIFLFAASLKSILREAFFDLLPLFLKWNNSMYSQMMTYNCASYISHKFFNFVSCSFCFSIFLLAGKHFSFFPQRKALMFWSTIFWREGNSNKQPNSPMFSSNN